MNAKLIRIQGLTLLAGMQVTFADQPVIKSFNPNTGLVWTNPIQGNLSVIERSTNLGTGPWVPFFYDWGTNGLLTTHIPGSPSDQMFYRIGVQTNIPDPSLVMDLSFDNSFSNGTVLDISGHGNHGVRYSLTNWPSVTIGIAGVQAAHYRQPDPVMQGAELHNYGDYIAVTNWNGIAVLTNGTISVWAWFDTNSYAATALLDAGYNVASAANPAAASNSWSLERSYTANVLFVVNLPAASVNKVSFPDDTIYNGGTSTYATTNWHWYCVTWNAKSNQIVGYYDGTAFSTNTMDAPFLCIYSPYHWLAIGCSHHEGTPQLDYGLPNGDMYPNSGWMGGSIDDVRIYNRALSGTEIAALYQSFDNLPPAAPSNPVAMVTSSSQVALHWSPASGIFGIAGYVLRRNGSVVATTTNTVFFDGGLPPQSTNSYTVQAFDPGSNYSAESAAVVAVTLPSGSGVDLILDDADGLPWVTQFGTWVSVTSTILSGYYGSGFMSEENIDVGESLIFRPPLPESGNYTVYIQYPGKSDISYLFASAVPVDIVHNGVTNTVIVDEQDNFGTWNSLGQFSFSAGTNDFVQLRTDGTSGYVFGDAFRFVK